MTRVIGGAVAGVGSQTPFLLRFFDSYLRNAERPEWDA
jgi:hypothetical protein